MTPADFRNHGRALVEWIADYLTGSERYPVLPRVSPGRSRSTKPRRCVTRLSWCHRPRPRGCLGVGRPRSRARDRTITDVRTLGRRRWKQEAGYQLQARVENAFFRYTSILGDRLRARSRGGRVAESVVACTVLNQMTELGRPESYSIGRCLASGLESLTVSFESCTSAVLTRWASLRPRRSSFQTTSTSPFRSARTQLSSPGRSSRTPDAKSW